MTFWINGNDNYEADTISRQAAIDALEQIFDRCEEIEAHLPEGDPDRTGYKMLPDYMTVWKYLHQLPFVQPDIIHCKDCKYWQDQEEGIVEVPICARPENKYEKFPLVMLIDGDGFCSYAERRTDGQAVSE